MRFAIIRLLPTNSALGCIGLRHRLGKAGFAPNRLSCVSAFLLLWLLCESSYCLSSKAGEPLAETIDLADLREVQNLGDRSHHRRLLAKERLRQRGTKAEDALRTGLNSTELEIRIAAKELLEEMSILRMESAMQHFLQGGEDIDSKIFPSWHRMKLIAGDTLETRKLFASMIPAYSTSLKWLDSLESDPTTQLEADTIGVDAFLPIDNKRLNEGDAARWALLLLAASNDTLKTMPILNSRIRSGLLNDHVTARLQTSPYAPVVKRLISNWLSESSEVYINASMLKIAINYRCESTALDMSGRLLSNPRSSPYAISSALIILARLRPETAAATLPHWFDDSRICHVWQIVTGSKTVIQTQIGDVATALALHIHGEDPREAGFANIEADPVFIYREFSMGFDDEATRNNVKLRARQILENRPTSTLAE